MEQKVKHHRSLRALFNTHRLVRQARWSIRRHSAAIIFAAIFANILIEVAFDDGLRHIIRALDNLTPATIACGPQSDVFTLAMEWVQ